MSDEYDSIISRALSHIERHQSLPTAPTYVPYRPWNAPSPSLAQDQKSPTRVDSHADMSGMQELPEEKNTTDFSGMEPAVSSSFTEDAGPSSLMRISKLELNAEREHYMEQPERTSIEQSVPPMPTRAPPSSPIHRNKFKPPVPPRRRAYRVTNLSTLTERSLLSETASLVPAPLVFRNRSQTVPSEVTHTDVVSHMVASENGLLSHRRASTGELRSRNVKPCGPLLAIGINRSRSARKPISQSVPSSPQAGPVKNTRRTRSASAPESRGSRSRSWPSLNPPKPEAEDGIPVEDLTGTGIAVDEPFAVESTPEAIRASLEALRLVSIYESWNNPQWLKAES